MARLGVTYLDIAKAAAAIRADGIEPTVDRVREWLGTGSRSTIAPLLKKWRSERVNNEEMELPQDLVEAMKALSARVKVMADSQLERMRCEFDAGMAELEEKLSREAASTAALMAENTDLKNQVAAGHEQTSALARELEQLRIRLARVEVTRDDAVSEVATLRGQLAEQKSELQAARKQSEHFQQAVAEDRRQERAEQLLQIQQYQGQLKTLLDQVTTIENRYSDLNKTCQNLRVELAERTEANLTLSDRNNRLKGDMESIMLRMKEVILEKDRMQTRLDASTRQTVQAAAALGASLETSKQLALSLEKTEKRLTQAEDAMKQLALANKDLARQKSESDEELMRTRRTRRAEDKSQPSLPTTEP